MEKKSSFSSRIGFVLAAAGSAVGLGNIWRFPYLAAKYGGGIFLLVYLILALTFGFSVMIAEIALGRKTRKSPIEAYKLADKRFGFLGYIASAVPMIILPYYCVIGGWVMKYFTVYITGQGAAAANGEFFNSFTSSAVPPVVFMAVYLFLTAAVVFMGVEKGIEKASTVLMPVLLVISVGTAVYALTLDGAMEGLVYYIKPDFGRFSIKTVVAAMGQLFYSMSLAMGIMITYGSYMRKEDNLENSVHQIEIFDTAVAFLSGLMIVPAVFAFSGGDESALQAGPKLMFVTLPNVFATMTGGGIFGIVFFMLVLLAALTSSISLMETVVSIFCDKLKMGRKKICLLVMALCFVLALPSALGYSVLSDVKIFGYSFLDFFDFLANNILMPIVAFAFAVLIGYVAKPKIVIDEVKTSGEFKLEKMFTFMIRYIVPVFMVIILVSSLCGYV